MILIVTSSFKYGFWCSNCLSPSFLYSTLTIGFDFFVLNLSFSHQSLSLWYLFYFQQIKKLQACSHSFKCLLLFYLRYFCSWNQICFWQICPFSLLYFCRWNLICLWLICPCYHISLSMTFLTFYSVFQKLNRNEDL